MKKMMKLVLLLCLTIFTVNTSFAGNSVFIQQDNQEGQSIFIKQDGTNNKFGVSTSYPFIIDGNDLTVIIRQIGDGNKTDWSNHNSFKGDNMTFDYNVVGDNNTLRPDIDDTGAEGHYYDIDITGDSNNIDFDTWTADDMKLFNVDLDIVGDSNVFWVRSRGDGHFLYVLMNGDSNDVQFWSPADSEGFNTNANKAIGPNVASHGQFADTSGSEGATADIYIVGNSNRVHTSSYGTGNYQVHDVIGDSNILDLHSSYSSADTDPYGDTMIILGDNNYLKTVTSGNSNTLGLHMAGGNNKAYIYIYTSDATLNVAQLGGGNYANINISGSSQYDYTLNWTQDGSDTCTYSYNRNNQSSNVTDTQTNGC